MKLTAEQADFLSGEIHSDIDIFAQSNKDARASFIEERMEEEYSGDWANNSKKLALAFEDMDDIDELTKQQIEEIILSVALDPIA